MAKARKKVSRKTSEPPPPALDLNQRLSPHFTLREMLVTTHRHIDNIPNEGELERMRRFCLQFMEPVRERFGPIIVTSGFRCDELNDHIGGSEDSAHKYGCAGDFHALAPAVSCRKIVRWIVEESGLPYDQVIDEYTRQSNWVHLGMLRPYHEEEPRRQALKFESWRPRSERYTAFA